MSQQIHRRVFRNEDFKSGGRHKTETGGTCEKREEHLIGDKAPVHRKPVSLFYRRKCIFIYLHITDTAVVFLI